MTISFFLGPTIPALIRRLVAVFAIYQASAILMVASWFVLPIVRFFFMIAGTIAFLVIIVQLLGILRRVAMVALPSMTRNLRFFDDDYLLKLFRTEDRPVSWIWTPITMASLLIVTIGLIDDGLVSAGLFRFSSFEALQSHKTFTAALALVLCAFGLLAGTRFVSGAKSSLSGQFSVEYLPEDHWLSQRVGRMADKLGLEKRPEVGVTAVCNAFAMGRRSKAAVVIGKPLIEMLSEDELNAVIGHELGHIHSNDMQRMQFAEGFQRMLGNTILVISTLGIRMLAKDRAGAALGSAVGNLFRHTVFVGTELAVKGLSRSREYVADAIGARLASPDAMIGALERIHGVAARPTQAESRYGYLMFKGSSFGAFFSTHPTLEARIRALRQEPSSSSTKSRDSSPDGEGSTS
jgi:Zn-dependent protease with chaperone function